MAGQLIVSVSGISDRTRADVDVFCSQLDERDVPASFLVAPRIKGGYRLDSDAPTVAAPMRGPARRDPRFSKLRQSVFDVVILRAAGVVDANRGVAT